MSGNRFVLCAAVAAFAALLSLPAGSAVVTFDDRNLFVATVPDPAGEDFSAFGGTGCNAFENVPAYDCGPGPLTIDFGPFSVEAISRPENAPGVNLVDPDTHLRVTGGGLLQIGGHAGIGSNFRTTATFVFDSPVSAFGIDAFSLDAPLEVVLFDGDEEVAGFAVPPPPGGEGFFGVLSDQAFTSLEIRQSLQETASYDDLLYTPVPVMPGVWLLVSALGSLAAARKRRSVGAG